MSHVNTPLPDSDVPLPLPEPLNSLMRCCMITDTAVPSTSAASDIANTTEGDCSDGEGDFSPVVGSRAKRRRKMPGRKNRPLLSPSAAASYGSPVSHDAVSHVTSVSLCQRWLCFFVLRVAQYDCYFFVNFTLKSISKISKFSAVSEK